MIRRIRPIGNSYGLIIDKSVLDFLKLGDGSPVEVSLAPGGKGILLTPASEDDAKAAHTARVRTSGDRVMKRHGGAFKKLAE